MARRIDSRQGSFVETVVTGERVRAFVPSPLPPSPSVDLLPLLAKLSAAERALGRLDGFTVLAPRDLLPSHELFLYMYLRKEAVLSSQIEGTQSTLTDLLRFEDNPPDHAHDDVREVSNYASAMMFGMERLKSLPLSLRLIREMHDRLLDSGRGASANPGVFRSSQNWIGGTRPGNALFVPPPPAQMNACLHELEQFLHEDTSGLPPLIKAGLIHVQFETIHPFLDGNGRLGRMLITLYLCANGLLQQPLLYLSLYLKTHRNAYYEHLQAVREHGAWEEWLGFFLDAVAETASQAFHTANRIVDLFAADQRRITALGIRVKSSLQVHDAFKRRPAASAAHLRHTTKLSLETINVAVADLERLGLLSEITGKKRGRIFSYSAYLSILEEGTTPFPSASPGPAERRRKKSP